MRLKPPLISNMHFSIIKYKFCVNKRFFCTIVQKLANIYCVKINWTSKETLYYVDPMEERPGRNINYGI